MGHHVVTCGSSRHDVRVSVRLLHASHSDIKASSEGFSIFLLFVLASFWFLINCMTKIQGCKLSLKCSTLNLFNYGFGGFERNVKPW